jgi:hypothetical protein
VPTTVCPSATGTLPDVTNGYKWELYNLTDDYSENNDLSASNPAKLKELQALFLTEAAKYNVFPLDNTAFSRLLTPRPSAVAGRTEFTYTGENVGIPLGNAPSILDKGYTIKAEVTVPRDHLTGKQSRSLANTIGPEKYRCISDCVPFSFPKVRSIR